MPLICLMTLTVLAVFHPNGVKAQVQPPLNETLQDYWCWKQRVCRGIATVGECEEVGNLCRALNCGAPGTFDECRWKYVWACYPSCEETCTHVEPEEWAYNCGPRCKWLTYNHCACACNDLGVNTIEGGFYSQCR